MAPNMIVQDQVRLLGLPTGATIATRVIHRQPVPTRQCLLIHGNPGSMADWAEVIPLLSASTAVAAIDLPGFGLSPRPERDRALSLQELASNVLAVSDALSWEKPILVGHSHGAAVALALAAAYPHRVAAVVLIGSLGSPTHPTYRLLAAPGMMLAMRLLAATFRVSFLRPMLRFAINRSVADACFPETAPTEVQQHVFDLFCATPLTLLSMVLMARGNPCQQVLEAAASVSCPVSFLHGQLDGVVPVSHAEAVHRRIVDAGGASRFRTLSTAGHMVPLFQATAVTDAVDAVLPADTVSAHPSLGAGVKAPPPNACAPGASEGYP
jgi:pyruvate dehydrogenase E2 component (dihydrolipoamide acetyltransferase)